MNAIMACLMVSALGGGTVPGYSTDGYRYSSGWQGNRQSGQSGSPAASPGAPEDAVQPGPSIKLFSLWATGLPPNLAGKRGILSLVGFLPFGGVWGPILIGGVPFEWRWAFLPTAYYLVPCIVAFIPYGWICALPTGLAMSWLATQVALANIGAGAGDSEDQAPP